MHRRSGWWASSRVWPPLHCHDWPLSVPGHGVLSVSSYLFLTKSKQRPQSKMEMYYSLHQHNLRWFTLKCKPLLSLRSRTVAKKCSQKVFCNFHEEMRWVLTCTKVMEREKCGEMHMLITNSFSLREITFLQNRFHHVWTHSFQRHLCSCVYFLFDRSLCCENKCAPTGIQRHSGKVAESTFLHLCYILDKSLSLPRYGAPQSNALFTDLP